MSEELRARVGADAVAVAAARGIATAAEHADGQPPVSDQAFLAVAQGQRELLLFSEADGSTDPIAFGIIGEGELDLVVAPSHRGRGVGSVALSKLLARDQHSAPLLAWAHGVNPAADALLTRAGFTPVRSLYRMALDPALLPPVGSGTSELPAGYALRAFDPGSARDASEWVRVNAAAFASHPEQGRITEADFALMRQEPWFDAADLLLLEDASGVAGTTWIKTVAAEVAGDPPATELYAIGVDPARSGLGLGRLLLEATLARMAEHHPTSVELYVDGENERAVGMYERAGFTVASRSRQWLLPE